MGGTKRGSIGRQLLLVILAATIVALFLAGIAIVSANFVFDRRFLQEQTARLADLVADNSAEALASTNTGAGQHVLETLHSRRNILAACLYTENGGLFARYRRDSSGVDCPSRPGPDTVRSTMSRITVARGAFMQGRRVGTVYIERDLHDLHWRNGFYAALVFMLLGLSTAIAVRLTEPLRRRISQPIVELSETAHNVALTGDYTIRAAKQGEGETALLADSFNEMLRRIQEREVELQREKEGLEMRVRSRTRELQRQTAELERSNADLQQYASVASHDLQEPLRMVTAYVLRLSDASKDKLDEQQAEYARYALEASQRMKELIADLLEYSRVGSGDLKLDRVDTQQVVVETIENLELAIQEAHASMIIRGLPVLTADRSQMLQLFQNLVGNALKFRSDRPLRIEISAEPKDDGWLFHVFDNGIGIAPEHAETIFRMFHRLHDRTAYPGTGIGLAISKRIVERHGGRIWLDASGGKGARFFFFLPANIQQSGTVTTDEERPKAA